MEFLTTFTLGIPPGTPASLVDDTEAAEARRARQLAGQGPRSMTGDDEQRVAATPRRRPRPRAAGLLAAIKAGRTTAA